MAKREKDNQLPLSRVRTIMKSSPGTTLVSQDAVYLMTKCTEMFIGYMARNSMEASKTGDLDYNAVADFVQSQPGLSFIQEIIPKKMTVAECMKLIEERQAAEAAENQFYASSSSDDEERIRECLKYMDENEEQLASDSSTEQSSQDEVN